MTTLEAIDARLRELEAKVDGLVRRPKATVKWVPHDGVWVPASVPCPSPICECADCYHERRLGTMMIERESVIGGDPNLIGFVCAGQERDPKEAAD